MHEKKKRKALWIQHGLVGMLTAYFGYILAAGMRPGADILRWLAYEQEIINGLPGSLFCADYLNRYTILVIAVCETAYFFYAFIHYLENRDLMPGSTYGTAQWADPERINDRIMDKGYDSKGKKRPDSCFYYVDSEGGYHEGRYHRWNGILWRLRRRKEEMK